MMAEKKGARLDKEKIADLARVLEKKFAREKRHDAAYPLTKEILARLATSVLLASVFIAPGTAKLAYKSWKQKKKEQWKEWKKFNPCYLRRQIKRLQKQKLVQIEEEKEKQVVKITEKGRERVLQYALEEMEIERPKVWDRKWRLVIYDIPQNKKRLQEVLREALKRLGFLGLQKSVWLYPFPCQDEVEFLREYYRLGEYVLFLTVAQLENDRPYREYFGLESG